MLALSSGWADQYMSADYPFYTGQMAMYVDGEWMTGPNFISAFKPEASYGVAPFPPPADHPERANTAVVQGTVAVIPAGAKNKEASAKLLAWMMSPEIVAEEFCFNANLPTSKKAAQDPVLHRESQVQGLHRPDGQSQCHLHHHHADLPRIQ